MYDFPFRNSLLCHKPNLKVQPQPFQHQLPLEIPFESQFNKFIRHNEDMMQLRSQGSSNFYSLQKTKVASQMREKLNQTCNYVNTHKTYTFNDNNPADCANVIAEKQLDSLFQTKIEKLQQIIAHKDLTIQALEGQARQISKARDILQSENIKLSEKVRESGLLFINNQQKYQEIIKAYQQQIEKMTIELKNGAKVQLQRQNKILLSRVKKLQSDLITKEKQIITKRRIHEQQNQQSRKLLQKLNQNVKVKQNKLIKELQQSRIEVQQLKNQIEYWKQKVGKIQSEKQLVQSTSCKLIQQKQQKLVSCEHNQKQLVQIYQHKLQQLNLVIEGLKQEIHLNRQQSSANLQELEKYKQDRRNQQSILVQTQQKLNNFQQYLDKLQFDKTELQSKNQVLQADLQNYEARIANLEQEKQQLLHQRQCLKKQIQHSDRKTIEMQKEITSLRMQLQQKGTSVNMKDQQIKTLQSIVNQHLARISDLQIESKRSHAELSNQRAKLGEIQSQLRFIQQKNKQITAKYYKAEKLVTLYKEQGKNCNNSTQGRWLQLKEIYEEQLQKLQHKLREYEIKTRELKKSMLQNSQTQYCKLCNTNPIFCQKEEGYNRKMEGNSFLSSYNGYSMRYQEDCQQQVPSFKVSLQSELQRKQGGESSIRADSNRKDQGKQNGWNNSHNRQLTLDTHFI